MGGQGKKGSRVQHIHLRQSITITGLGCRAFEDAATVFHDTYHAISSTFTRGKMLDWQCGIYEGHAALTFNARYFTLRRHAPNERTLPWGEGVDPQGLLEKLRGQNMIHGPDNKVAYRHRLEAGGKVQ